jgi:hypothetical protein
MSIEAESCERMACGRIQRNLAEGSVRDLRLHDPVPRYGGH